MILAIALLCCCLLVIASMAIIDLSSQFVIRWILKRRVVGLETAGLFVLILLSIGALVGMTIGAAQASLEEPGPFIAASLGFFITLLIAYMQCKSILSRGYSIRILSDIAAAEKRISIEKLKSSYGGMGMEGMLRKRIRSLATLGLVRFDGKNVGPLSLFGKTLAKIGRSFRRLYNLGEVG